MRAHDQDLKVFGTVRKRDVDHAEQVRHFHTGSTRRQVRHFRSVSAQRFAQIPPERIAGNRPPLRIEHDRDDEVRIRVLVVGAAPDPRGPAPYPVLVLLPARPAEQRPDDRAQREAGMAPQRRAVRQPAGGTEKCRNMPINAFLGGVADQWVEVAVAGDFDAITGRALAEDILQQLQRTLRGVGVEYVVLRPVHEEHRKPEIRSYVFLGDIAVAGVIVGEPPHERVLHGLLERPEVDVAEHVAEGVEHRLIEVLVLEQPAEHPSRPVAVGDVGARFARRPQVVPGTLRRRVRIGRERPVEQRVLPVGAAVHCAVHEVRQHVAPQRGGDMRAEFVGLRQRDQRPHLQQHGASHLPRKLACERRGAEHRRADAVRDDVEFLAAGRRQYTFHDCRNVLDGHLVQCPLVERRWHCDAGAQLRHPDVEALVREVAHEVAIQFRMSELDSARTEAVDEQHRRPVATRLLAIARERQHQTCRCPRGRDRHAVALHLQPFERAGHAPAFPFGVLFFVFGQMEAPEVHFQHNARHEQRDGGGIHHRAGQVRLADDLELGRETAEQMQQVYFQRSCRVGRATGRCHGHFELRQLPPGIAVLHITQGFQPVYDRARGQDFLRAVHELVLQAHLVS